MTNTTVANAASRMVTNPYRVGTEEFYVCKERLYESIRRSHVIRSERPSGGVHGEKNLLDNPSFRCRLAAHSVGNQLICVPGSTSEAEPM
jgi:hypothetical protein